MSSCECSYLKSTVCKSALYGTYKVATTTVVNKAPKVDGDILTQKVSKGKMRNEILMDVGVYALAQYGYWYLSDSMMMSYEPDMVKDLPINVVENVYKAVIISGVDAIRGKASMNSFIRELLLVSATDFTYQALDGMDNAISTRSVKR